MEWLAVYIGVAIGLIILAAGAVSYTAGRTDKPAQIVRGLYAVVWIACVVYGIGMFLRAGRIVIGGMPALTPLVTLEQLSARWAEEEARNLPPHPPGSVPWPTPQQLEQVNAPIRQANSTARQKWLETSVIEGGQRGVAAWLPLALLWLARWTFTGRRNIGWRA